MANDNLVGSLPAKSSSHFRSDIQGLRAVAVGAVVFYHAGIPFLPGGYVGVDVFFVISGFLITTHLLSSLHESGRIPFASFYAKRVRRILPASFAVIALSLIAALIWYPPLLIKEVWQGALASALYAPNILFAIKGTDYLSESTPSLFQHYWSLGIEEQFYLIWPVLLLLLFSVFKRTSVRFSVVAALVMFSFIAGISLTLVSQPWAFFGLPTRAWELGVGGLAAFLLSRRPKPLAGPIAAVVGWGGLITVCATVLFFSSETPFPGYWAAIPVLGTAAVIVAGESAARYSPTRLLSTRPMQWVGLVSYSLYLVHWPLLQVPQAAVGFEHPLPLSTKLALAALSFPVAWLLYRFVEVPGRTGAWLSAAPPRRSLFSAAGMSVAAILLATSIFVYSNSRALSESTFAPQSGVTNPPVATEFVPSNLVPSLRSAEDDKPEIYDDGCHLDFSATEPGDCVFGPVDAPRIVLFGDSHAAQWFPALHKWAEAEGYALENHTKSSCPSVMRSVLRDGVPYTECDQWRESVIRHLNSEEPALVVLASYPGTASADSSGDLESDWETALGNTLEAVEAPKVVIADTPHLGETPSVCLSANLTTALQCSVARSDAFNVSARAGETSATTDHKVPYVNLNDYICDADRCPSIIGNTLVYRDAHHLTATFSEQLSSVLGEQLELALRQDGA